MYKPFKKYLVVAIFALSIFAPSVIAQQPAQPQPSYSTALSELQYAIGVLGYVYGTPLFELSLAEARQVGGRAEEVVGPRGAFAHFRNKTRGGLPDYDTTWFGSPNPDVLYSSAWLDIENGPWVIYVPPMDDTWYSVQFEDYFMNNQGYLSSRTIGRGDGFFLITHEPWEKKLPWGIRDTVQIPTPVTWILLRIEANIQNQQQRIAKYQERFKLIPLEEYLKDPLKAKNLPLSTQCCEAPPLVPKGHMRGTIDVYGIINHQLRSNPIPEADRGLVALFELAGFGPKQIFIPAKLPGQLRQTLARAATSGAEIVDRMRFRPYDSNRNWSFAPPWLGRYGQDYLLRAIAAFGGIGANDIEEAVYPNAYYDSEGRLLSGEYSYTIRFEAGQLPPAKAFWSISAYDAAERRFFKNDLNRFSLGSNQSLQWETDGSLTIYIASRPPRQSQYQANWIPVDHGRQFYLLARIYHPLPEALKSGYDLPPIIRQ